MSSSLIVSIFAKDRVGIIADVTKAVLDLDGDLGDLNQVVMDGYFTMILIAEFKGEIEDSILRNKILDNFVEDEKDVSIAIRSLEHYTCECKGISNDESRYVMTATSNNREGLVAEIGEFCKQNQINILSLATKLSDEKYIMMFYIDLSAIMFHDVLRKKIKEFSTEKDMHIVLQHSDIFKATNEIKYYK